MTDNEIIKALECCCANNNCDGCPLDYLTFSSECASKLAINSLDLINRQKAEIERLENEYRWLDQESSILAADVTELSNQLKTAKAGAYKEFAERLKKEKSLNWLISTEDVEDLLKEMDGANND